MITQKMAASKDIAATWGGGRAEGAGRPSGPVRNGPDRSGPPLPCRGLDPCSSPVFCRQVESLQAAYRLQVPKDLSAFKCPRVPGARSGGRSPAPKLIF